MLPGQDRYYRLDLKPDSIDNQHARYTRNTLHCWSPKRIFAETDLYTTRWGQISNTEMEQFFFGRLDSRATSALDYYETYTRPMSNESAFRTLMSYMSVQKLRTPKGLAQLSAVAHTSHRNVTLLLLQQIQNIYCAIWTESVWQIADASSSSTKFIISDHPVTVYNRACPPQSAYCRRNRDPDIRMHATHTYFPLSLNKILILTNLSWVRNPYQNEIRLRPNPDFFRPALFNSLDIQIDRELKEDEVIQINFITKRRALRYIASAREEWLYPERMVSTKHWKKLGNGYLLMPEPRLVNMGGQVYIGYKDGSTEAFSEYGHRPWQEGYEDKKRENLEWKSSEIFKAEWAMHHGALYTARTLKFGDGQRREDSSEVMDWYRKTISRHRRSKRLSRRSRR